MTQNESNVQINSLAGPNTLNYEASIRNDLQGTFYDVNPEVNLYLKNNEDSIKVLKRFRIYRIFRFVNSFVEDENKNDDVACSRRLGREHRFIKFIL